MAHAAYIREKARSLRIERKLTIDQLAERLALSRSTVYYWVRDLPIPGSGSGGGWPESARRKGNRSMQVKYRGMREKAYREGLDSFEELARDPTFRDFICLYIAEGYKRSRHTASICNSGSGGHASRHSLAALSIGEGVGLLDPIPRRSGSGSTARVLGTDAWG